MAVYTYKVVREYPDGSRGKRGKLYLYRKIKINLNFHKARRKITRASLAEKIHKTPTTLSLKLNGKAPITLSECIEIKNAIGAECTIDYLFATDMAT